VTPDEYYAHVSPPRKALSKLLSGLAQIVLDAGSGNSVGWRGAVRAINSLPMLAEEIEIAENPPYSYETKTPWEMGQLGWQVENTVNLLGWGKSTGCSIRIRRWDWHGDHGDAHFLVNYTTEDGYQDAYDRCCRKALQAWKEYRKPGCPPNGIGKALKRDKLKEGMRDRLFGDDDTKVNTTVEVLLAELDNALGLPMFANEEDPVENALDTVQED